MLLLSTESSKYFCVVREPLSAANFSNSLLHDYFLIIQCYSCYEAGAMYVCMYL